MPKKIYASVAFIDLFGAIHKQNDNHTEENKNITNDSNTQEQENQKE